MVLLAKYAQYVALVHFPIAMFIVGVAFDWLAVRTEKTAITTAALLKLSVAA
jgi:uncharacterized membrane protein